MFYLGLQESLKDVSRKFERCFKGYSRVFQSSIKVISKEFKVFSCDEQLKK